MVLSPLKMQIQENLKSAVAHVLEKRHELFFGIERPMLSNETLTAGPMDAVILLAALSVEPSNELAVFDLRRMVLTQIELRLQRNTKTSAKTAYAQILEHARSTFRLGSIPVTEPVAPCRPKVLPPPRLRLVDN